MRARPHDRLPEQPLTEIVQIIGRATRDAEGKTRTRFTNLIAEPDASEDAVTDAVNDTLKAISASLLMEQVLAPRFNFTPKNADSGPKPGYDYGEEGYQKDQDEFRLRRKEPACSTSRSKALPSRSRPRASASARKTSTR